MEKISLYDFLSILLPGALLTLVIEFVAFDFGIDVNSIELNDYFILTIFLSSSIFLGSIINISTRKLLNLYTYIGLYTPLQEIYEKSIHLQHIKPFFEKIMKSFKIEMNLDHISDDFKKEKEIKNIKLEYLWDNIYYELEAKQSIGAPKAFQSFYFFFRNFFTLGIILFIPFLSLLLFRLLFYSLSSQYIFIFGLNLISTILSVPAARWNRKQMAEKMFWTYYSLNKNK